MSFFPFFFLLTGRLLVDKWEIDTVLTQTEIGLKLVMAQTAGCLVLFIGHASRS